jgi:hypothetical protein
MTAARTGCEAGCRVKPGNDKEVVKAGLYPAKQSGRGRGAHYFSDSQA